MKRFYIILIAVLCALTGFARATDNKTFERFYNLTPKEFNTQLKYYIDYNQIDSAMLCANVQASKYGKEKLSIEEIATCCNAFRFIGMEYFQRYYNYQLAAESLFKAEQIAATHSLVQQQVVIAMDKPIILATKNDLATNFTYSSQVLDSFMESFYVILNYIKSNPNYSPENISYLEITLTNICYLAIKFGKTSDIAQVVRDYNEFLNHYSPKSNTATTLCHVVECCNAGDNREALNTIQTTITRDKQYSKKNSMQFQSLIDIVRYCILIRNENTASALKLLLEKEQFLRENAMTIELLEVLQLIKQHYEVDGNETMANKYSLLYFTTKDEFINKSRLGKMDEAKLNIELEQTRENVREMANRQKMQTIVLWSAIIIALLALTILAVLYVNYRKTQRTNRVLYEKNVALLRAEEDRQPKTAPEPEANHNQVSDAQPTQTDKELMEKINEVMATSPEVFESGFTLNRMTELVGSNTMYVSRAINNCRKCNFSTLLNEYRIKEACRRLLDKDKYANFTIETIANSVGYKSRTNFTKVFKDITGISPSEFQKMSKANKQEGS